MLNCPGHWWWCTGLKMMLLLKMLKRWRRRWWWWLLPEESSTIRLPRYLSLIFIYIHSAWKYLQLASVFFIYFACLNHWISTECLPDDIIWRQVFFFLFLLPAQPTCVTHSGGVWACVCFVDLMWMLVFLCLFNVHSSAIQDRNIEQKNIFDKNKHRPQLDQHQVSSNKSKTIIY